ncbi:MAG: hypothetical protein KME27_20795 [Lyngbya sp. HA4199-MV5]|nr:hypothetical protein [Lyngbya sp. HA4199-MV5]
MRGYAYLGEGGKTLWNEGYVTAETELGLAFFDQTSPQANQPGYWERIDLQFPDEECVMQMARHWCLAPMDLTPDMSPSAIGLRGEFPSL